MAKLQFDEFWNFVKANQPPRERRCIECTAAEDIKQGHVLEYFGRASKYIVRKARKRTKKQRLAGSADHDAKKGQKIWVTYQGTGDVLAANTTVRTKGIK